MRTPHLTAALFFTAVVALFPPPAATQVAAQSNKPDKDGFVALFPEDGVPKGWTVRAWNDVKDPPAQPTQWKVEKGVLHGGEQVRDGLAHAAQVRARVVAPEAGGLAGRDLLGRSPLHGVSEIDRANGFVAPVLEGRGDDDRSVEGR